jgi:hypothetical protein
MEHMNELPSVRLAINEHNELAELNTTLINSFSKQILMSIPEYCKEPVLLQEYERIYKALKGQGQPYNFNFSNDTVLELIGEKASLTFSESNSLVLLKTDFNSWWLMKEISNTSKWNMDLQISYKGTHAIKEINSIHDFNILGEDEIKLKVIIDVNLSNKNTALNCFIVSKKGDVTQINPSDNAIELFSDHINRILMLSSNRIKYASKSSLIPYKKIQVNQPFELLPIFIRHRITEGALLNFLAGNKDDIELIKTLQPSEVGPAKDNLWLESHDYFEAFSQVKFCIVAERVLLLHGILSSNMIHSDANKYNHLEHSLSKLIESSYLLLDSESRFGALKIIHNNPELKLIVKYRQVLNDDYIKKVPLLVEFDDCFRFSQEMERVIENSVNDLSEGSKVELDLINSL